MDPSRQRARGRINVTSCDSKPYDDAGDFAFSEVHITEEFSGDLVGVGSVRFLMVTEPEGTAHFTGMERFTGEIGDRAGSFILRNSGILKDGELNSTWQVIPGSGTEELAGLCGEGRCDPAGYTFDYWFE
ncbi:MAG: DUF3224 domain-containing protein [Terracidiphilus sp.]